MSRTASDNNESDASLIERRRAFWRGVGESLIKGSTDKLDELAKQIIAVAGVLLGFYVNAIAVSNLRGKIADVGSQVVYLTPIALLLASLTAAIIAFLPRLKVLDIDAPDASKLLFKRLLERKRIFAVASSILLVLGIVALLVALQHYLA